MVLLKVVLEQHLFTRLKEVSFYCDSSEMGAYRTLDFVINDILMAVKPQQQDWVTRFHIIDELRKVIESVESLRGNDFLCVPLPPNNPAPPPLPKQKKKRKEKKSNKIAALTNILLKIYEVCGETIFTRRQPFLPSSHCMPFDLTPK